MGYQRERLEEQENGSFACRVIVPAQFLQAFMQQFPLRGTAVPSTEQEIKPQPQRLAVAGIDHSRVLERIGGPAFPPQVQQMLGHFRFQCFVERENPPPDGVHIRDHMEACFLEWINDGAAEQRFNELVSRYEGWHAEQYPGQAAFPV